MDLRFRCGPNLTEMTCPGIVPRPGGMRLNIPKLFVALSVILSLVLLAGCGGLSRPFGKGSNAPVAALYDKAPPVTIVSANGVPGGKQAALAQYVAQAAKQRGFTVNSKAPNKRGYRMAGQLTAQNTSKGTVVIFVWDVTDPIGSARHRISGREIIPQAIYENDEDGESVSPAGNSSPWAQVDEIAMSRIAARTAEGLATYLGQNGFYVRHVGLPPPYDVPAPKAATASAQGAKPAPTHTAAAKTGNVPAVATGSLASTASKRSVLVSTVEGVDEASGKQLAAAVRLALGSQGFNVEGKSGKKTIRVAGSISLGDKAGAQQPVSVRWKVIDSKGTLVGTVKQDNKVPAVMLENGWGPIAPVVANAAAGGIIDLLVRAR